jgi:ArsR family transcriptional regulator, arsenate/arsenite/antimonite-responsive transcriptional repressor
MPKTELTTQQFQRISRAIAEPTRYEMLRRIFNCRTLNCTEAANDLTISAATGSHHLRELELADLIRVTKDGRFRKLEPRRKVWRAYLALLREL